MNMKKFLLSLMLFTVLPSLSLAQSSNVNVRTSTPMGAQTDSACGTATGTCSAIALLKFLNTVASGAVPAGSNLIGAFNLSIAAAVNSATNGIYTNLLQGNAVISATNGLFSNQLQGNAVLSATNGAFTNILQGNAVNSVTNPIFVEQAANADPCSASTTKTNYAVLITGTTTVKIVGEVSAQQIYICSVALIASAATVMSIADGTKNSTECDTAAHAIFGQTTATHGMSLAANGGFTAGSGNGTVGRTATAAHDLCIFQSGSGDISGNITVVQQ